MGSSSYFLVFFGVGVRLQDLFDAENTIVHQHDNGVHTVPSRRPDLICRQLVRRGVQKDAKSDQARFVSRSSCVPACTLCRPAQCWESWGL